MTGHRLGRCEVTGKAQYTTRAIAKRVAKSFNDDSRPFRCEHCDLIHLGHLKSLTRQEHREYHAAAQGAAKTITQPAPAGATLGAQRGYRRPHSGNQKDTTP